MHRFILQDMKQICLHGLWQPHRVHICDCISACGPQKQQPPPSPPCVDEQLCLGWEETPTTTVIQHTRILREKTRGAKQAAEEANKFAKYHRVDHEQNWK